MQACHAIITSALNTLSAMSCVSVLDQTRHLHHSFYYKRSSHGFHTAGYDYTTVYNHLLPIYKSDTQVQQCMHECCMNYSTIWYACRRWMMSKFSNYFLLFVIFAKLAALELCQEKCNSWVEKTIA